MRACLHSSDMAVFATQTRQCSGWVSVCYHWMPQTEAGSLYLMAGVLVQQTVAAKLSFPKAMSCTKCIYFLLSPNPERKQSAMPCCSAGSLIFHAHSSWPLQFLLLFSKSASRSSFHVIRIFFFKTFILVSLPFLVVVHWAFRCRRISLGQHLFPLLTIVRAPSISLALRVSRTQVVARAEAEL